MPVPAPAMPDVYQVRLQGTYIGEVCNNVIAVQDLTGTRTVDDVSTDVEAWLATTLASGTGTAYRAVISNGRTWESLHTVRYDADDPGVIDNALIGAAYTGTSAGHGLPYQVAMCVSLTTGFASRRKRGRLFDYGFTESNNDAVGRVDATARAAVQAFWGAIATGLEGSDLPWVILSRGWIEDDPDSTRESFAQSVTPVLAVTVRDNLWDTMRSRVPR